ncbi:hypothetical protein BG418_06250 [Streptomyces sp. CBMA152]|nr:hypothetical protein [Streptomyces sp. CBMA152]
MAWVIGGSYNDRSFMRTALLRRGARAAAVTALAVAGALGGMANADASAGARHHHGPKPIDIGIDTSGIHAQDDARGGLRTFRVHTDDVNGRQLQLLRPHHGVTLKKIFADLTKAVSRMPVPTAQGITALRDEADAPGGAFVTRNVSESFTTRVKPGRLVLLDFSAFLKDPAHPVFRVMHLHDGNQGSLRTDHRATVVTRETPAGPRFDVRGLHEAKDPILFHNAADELHEMQLQPVTPGTTDAQLQAYFDKIAAGKPATAPFTGPALGLGAVSPGGTVLLRAHHLPPGTYALLCFIPDDKNGVPHAFLGMHKVVVLH